MTKLLRTLLVALLVIPFISNGQVVTTQPAIVQMDSRDVIITFHADRGNGQLASLGADDAIYAHTGVITDQSANGGDWKYAPSWGDNSPKFKLLYVSDNTWELIIPSIKEYYNLPDGVNVTALAFVFRNADGSLQGKEADGADIYVQVYPEGFQMTLGSDMEGLALTDSSPVNFTVNTTSPAKIAIYLNGTEPEDMLISQDGVTTLTLAKSFIDAGDYAIIAVATTSTENKQCEYGLTRLGDAVAETFPGGVPKQGVTLSDDGKETYFCLAAPDKENVALVGSWNNYQITAGQTMNYQEYDGNRYFWTGVKDIPKGKDVFYYYLVDGEIPVGDPYAHLVLDPNNDRYISSDGFPTFPLSPRRCLSLSH